MPKPFTISGTPTSAMMNRIDAMFTELYRLAGGPHAILSAAHSDVVVPSTGIGLVRGSMLVVNSDRKWEQLTPETAGTFPRYDGADTTFAAVTEPDITDGSILARVASDETITGRWFFSGTGRLVLANAVPMQARNSTDTADLNILMLTSQRLEIGVNNSELDEIRYMTSTTTGHVFQTAGTTRLTVSTTEIVGTVGFRGPNGSASNPSFGGANFSTTGMFFATGPLCSITVSNGEAIRWDGNLTTFLGGSLCAGATLTPATLSAGNNDNYNPTNFGVNFGFRVTGNATISTITSITAPAAGLLAGDGRIIALWNIGSPDWLVLHDDGATGTAANRILTGDSQTRRVKTNGYWVGWYDTTSNRWRELAYAMGGPTHGTWTPTLTNTTNIDASTNYLCTYSRVGDTVTFSGKVDIDATAAGDTVLGISLPIASAFSAEEQLGGTACSPVTGESAALLADATNDRITLRFPAVDTTNRAWHFSGQYRIL